MKSLASSPQKSPRAVKGYRVDSLPAGANATSSQNLRKPSLRIEELPKDTMNAFQPFGARTPSPGPGLLSPVQQDPSRKSSAENLSTASRTDSLQPNGASPSENSAPWSTAVGSATITGKSGRVIERLMTENDKLKREMNEQRIKCQDLEKSLQTYKPQIDALRHENDNLSHARDVDSGLISRRDRKIEELRADLASEKQRREQAETLARQREQEKDHVEEQSKRDIQQMTESTKHATVHAEILETSHKHLSAEYRARAEAWKHDLADIAKDREKLARLDIVTDQMRQELERSRKFNGEIMEMWERLREENDARMRSIENEANEETDRSRSLSTEMDKVVNEMRWLMGVKKNVRDADQT